MASRLLRFLDHSQRRSKTPLDEWTVSHRDLYLTTHNATNIHAPGGNGTHNISRRAAAYRRFRPRCHWDREVPCLLFFILNVAIPALIPSYLRGTRSPESPLWSFNLFNRFTETICKYRRSVPRWIKNVTNPLIWNFVECGVAMAGSL
jgi:hypothetical protein